MLQHFKTKEDSTATKCGTRQHQVVLQCIHVCLCQLIVKSALLAGSIDMYVAIQLLLTAICKPNVQLKSLVMADRLISLSSCVFYCCSYWVVPSSHRQSRKQRSGKFQFSWNLNSAQSNYYPTYKLRFTWSKYQNTKIHIKYWLTQCCY